MTKITFENLPSTNTPISAENLNNNFDAMHHIGSVHITTTNTNPSSELDGSWSLIDKSFANAYRQNSDTFNIFTPSENISDYACSIIRTGHSIKVIMSYTPSVTITDDIFTIGTLNFELLGISGTIYTRRFLGFNDTSTTTICHLLNYSSGVLQAVDVIPNNVTANSTCYVQFEIDITRQYMLDSACDKFYWKRTS